MTLKSRWIPAAGISVAMLGLLATDAQAQTATHLSYAAKFVCGARTVDRGVVTGLYETTVNVHNPHYQPVVALKKAVIALPQSEPPGPISKFVTEQFGPDAALGVNCRDIRVLFDPPPGGGFIEGFVVLLVRRQTPLDVVSVVTGRPRATDSDVHTINIYEVTPKAVVPPTGG